MSEILAGTKIPALDLAVRIERLTAGIIRPADFIPQTAKSVDLRSQEEKRGRDELASSMRAAPSKPRAKDEAAA